MDAPTPLRPSEERAGGFITAHLGGQAKSLPVLPRARNREFQRIFADKVRATIQSSAKLDDLDDVIGLMSSAIDDMLEIVLIYDETAALGGREWIDAHATDGEIYELFKKVANAAHPFGKDLVALLPELRGMLLTTVMRMAGSRSTSSSPPSTGGRRKKSKAA